MFSFFWFFFLVFCLLNSRHCQTLPDNFRTLPDITRHYPINPKMITRHYQTLPDKQWCWRVHASPKAMLWCEKAKPRMIWEANTIHNNIPVSSLSQNEVVHWWNVGNGLAVCQVWLARYQQDERENPCQRVQELLWPASHSPCSSVEGYLLLKRPIMNDANSYSSLSEVYDFSLLEIQK